MKRQRGGGVTQSNAIKLSATDVMIVLSYQRGISPLFKTGYESADESRACISGADPSSRINHPRAPSPLHIFVAKIAASLTPVLSRIISAGQRRRDRRKWPKRAAAFKAARTRRAVMAVSRSYFHPDVNIKDPRRRLMF